MLNGFHVFLKVAMTFICAMFQYMNSLLLQDSSCNWTSALSIFSYNWELFSYYYMWFNSTYQTIVANRSQNCQPRTIGHPQKFFPGGQRRYFAYHFQVADGQGCNGAGTRGNGVPTLFSCFLL